MTSRRQQAKPSDSKSDSEAMANFKASLKLTFTKAPELAYEFDKVQRAVDQLEQLEEMRASIESTFVVLQNATTQCQTSQKNFLESFFEWCEGVSPISSEPQECFDLLQRGELESLKTKLFADLNQMKKRVIQDQRLGITMSVARELHGLYNLYNDVRVELKAMSETLTETEASVKEQLTAADQILEQTMLVLKQQGPQFDWDSKLPVLNLTLLHLSSLMDDLNRQKAVAEAKRTNSAFNIAFSGISTALNATRVMYTPQEGVWKALSYFSLGASSTNFIGSVWLTVQFNECLVRINSSLVQVKSRMEKIQNLVSHASKNK